MAPNKSTAKAKFINKVAVSSYGFSIPKIITRKELKAAGIKFLLLKFIYLFYLAAEASRLAHLGL